MAGDRSVAVARFQPERWIPVLVLAACWLGVKPIWHALDAGLRAEEQVGTGLDPWGHSYRLKTGPLTMVFVSPGPNGLYEQGGGDDLVSWPGPKYELYARSREVVLRLGLLLGLGYLLNVLPFASGRGWQPVAAATGVGCLLAGGACLLLGPYLELVGSSWPWPRLVGPGPSLFFTVWLVGSAWGWVIRRGQAGAGRSRGAKAGWNPFPPAAIDRPGP